MTATASPPTLDPAAEPGAPRPLYRLYPRQQEAMALLGFSLDPNDRRAPVEEMLFGGQAGGGKLLDLGTVIPTTTGWKTLREVVPGDLVFGRDGAPARVVAQSEEVTAPAWRLTFDDGAQVVAHDDHEWLTFDAKELAGFWFRSDVGREARRAARAARGSRATGTKSPAFVASLAARNVIAGVARRLPPSAGTVRTTAEIVATLRTPRGRANHAVPVAGPLRLPERVLPLDPYLLGLWLGDGSSASGEVTTMDPEIVAAFEAGGFPVAKVKRKPNNRAATYRFDGLRAALRAVGVLGAPGGATRGAAKHVPHDYLWASEGQRAALLAGLLDTDGNPSGASVEFVNTRRGLTEAVAHLARSLGHKVRVREGVARLKGRDIGPKWSVKFAAHRVLFRLPRKALAQRIATRPTTRYRYVVAAERTGPVAMKCLRVDTDDHLYLCGPSFVPTHNSLLARALAITVMTVWPGCEVAIFRRTYPELEDSHIRPILRETADTAFGYHEGKRELRAPNGSLCLFRYADDEKDLRHYLSAEWACLIVDEATAFPGDWLEFLRARVRSTRTDWRPIILYTTNPGGIGHAYLKSQFVDPHPSRTVWTAADEDGGLRRVFLPAALKDNPALGSEYRRRLLGIKDETVRRALMEGDWNIGGNFFFAEWRPTKHVVPDFAVPDHWRTRAIGVDFGYGAPWSCHFYVRDEDLWRSERETRWFAYRELYGPGIRDEEQARLVKEAIAADLLAMSRGGRKQPGRLPTYSLFCDPAMWSKNPNGLSVAEVYRFVLADHGVVPQKADNDRTSGWQRVRDYLADQADGWPALVYFASCTEAIRTIPALPRDRRNPEDADSDAEDHCLHGDTLVQTEDGPVPIRDVRPGVRVWTRRGLRRVAAAWRQHDAAPVFRYRFSDGRSLVATDHHRIWTDRGWIPTGELRPTDTVWAWASPSPPALSASSITASSTTAIRRAVTKLCGAISHLPWAPGRRGTTASTGRSTRTPTEPFPTGTRSTTATATSPTTPPTTWRPNRVPDTAANTSLRNPASSPGTIWPTSSGRPGAGTSRLRASLGTAPRPDGYGLSAPPRPASASTAAQPSAATVPSPSTAPIAAGPPPVGPPPWTGRIASARSAVPPSPTGAGTPANAPARGPAVRFLGSSPAGTAPVYDLMVEGDPEFFADGLLVHNCADELRYVLMGLGAPAQAIDHPGYAAHERTDPYRLRSSQARLPAGAPGPRPAGDGMSLPANARVPELLRAASQQGRFVPVAQDASDRAMWARFAAAVRRANLGQAPDPYGRLR